MLGNLEVVHIFFTPHFWGSRKALWGTATVIW